VVLSSRLIEEPRLRSRGYVFRDRSQAGEMLAAKLEKYRGLDGIVLAIPSGGVPVGYAVARALGLPLDLAIARKILVPGSTEAGYGAVSWDGETALNHELVTTLGLTHAAIERGIAETRKVLEARMKRFRGDKPLPKLEGRVVIIVDDGLASGYTALACARSIRKRNPAKLVVAVPTASEEAVALMLPEVDELVCLNIRSGFIFAVADAYQHWYDLTDEEVLQYPGKAGEQESPRTSTQPCLPDGRKSIV